MSTYRIGDRVLDVAGIADGEQGREGFCIDEIRGTRSFWLDFAGLIDASKLHGVAIRQIPGQRVITEPDLGIPRWILIQ